MNKGMTLVEALIVVAIIPIISIVAIMFLYQTVVTRESVSVTEAVSNGASSLFTSIDNSVKSAKNLNVVNSTTLQVQYDTTCDVYTLSNQKVYVTSGSLPCPTPSTSSPVVEPRVSFTNQVTPTPTIAMFTGIPSGTNADAVLIKARARSAGKFAQKEVVFEHTVARRR